jgi:(E)-4-hydroxy-3-methyl-but-2-enyl pyrophosphate reductase
LRKRLAHKRTRSRPRPTAGRPTGRGKGLRVSVSTGVGFCSGVKRAIKIALEAAGRSPGGIYSFGPVIHNPQVVERLRGLGVKPLARLGKEGGTLVIRSHGAGPEDLDRARSRGFTIVDATCPIVRKAQENARRLHDLGYQVVIVGEHRHPEVKSLRGFVSGRSIVVEDVEDAKGLKFGRRVGIIGQTTIPVDTFANVVGLIARRAREVLVFNTVCSETARRQERARDLAGRVDVLLVVGGRNSANTTRLASLCRSICASTHHIETAEEIDATWFARGSQVGVVTGASTPRWLVNSVVNRLEKL